MNWPPPCTGQLIVLIKNYYIQIALNHGPTCSIDDTPSSVQVKALCQATNWTLPEPMTILFTHAYTCHPASQT